MPHKPYVQYTKPEILDLVHHIDHTNQQPRQARLLALQEAQLAADLQPFFDSVNNAAKKDPCEDVREAAMMGIGYMIGRGEDPKEFEQTIIHGASGYEEDFDVMVQAYQAIRATITEQEKRGVKNPHKPFIPILNAQLLTTGDSDDIDETLDLVDEIIEKTGDINSFYDALNFVAYNTNDPTKAQSALTTIKDYAHLLTKNDETENNNTKVKIPIAVLKDTIFAPIEGHDLLPVANTEDKHIVTGKIFYIPDESLRAQFEGKVVHLTTSITEQEVNFSINNGKGIKFSKIDISDISQVGPDEILHAETSNIGQFDY
tara:strand:- start:576 stop:1523 length:948 start_codon:yes stop_codon:yes gene_type:complete